MKIILFLSPLLLLSCFDSHVCIAEGDPPPMAQGGFQKVRLVDQETAPNMVLIEGRTLELEHGDPRNSTKVKTFYVSRYLEMNVQYVAYLDFLKTYYSKETYQKALPDTTVWLGRLQDEEKERYLIRNYLRHPSYRYYPVVGLKPDQIRAYAEWKTDRMNEMILIREGIYADVPPADSSEVFSTRSYFSEESPKQNLYDELPDLDPDRDRSEDRKLRDVKLKMEDGLLLPNYRLLTEAEWVLAALDMGDSYHEYAVSDGGKGLKEMNRFSYLGPKLKVKYLKEEVEVAPQNVRVVFDCENNNYGVYGLNSEQFTLVGNATMNQVIRIPQFYELEAYYLPLKPGGGKYIAPKNYPKAEQLYLHDIGLSGFRLGMDRMGKECINDHFNRRVPK